MSGLDITGFTPETLSDIQDRIKGKLDIFSPGFDFSPESPDGQLVDIMSLELWQAWNQLNQVYNSYDPSVATGAALRNLGQISGVSFTTAQRSYTTVEFQGTAGTIVPADSVVTDTDGNEFFIAFDTVIPGSGKAISKLAGPLPIPAGTITKALDASVTGWDGVTQLSDGVIGTDAMSDQQYRNYRQATVMRNYVGTADVMRARLLEAGIGQASVYSNNTGNVVNTVPSQHIAVVVDDIDTVDDETIAEIIFETNGVGCPTHSYPVTGATTVVLTDAQGFPQTVNFTKATAVEIEIKMDIKFLNDENAGALEAIREAVMDYVNGLPAGGNVIYSHLYQYITPYGDAQVDLLFLQKDGDIDGVTNINIGTSEFARITDDNLLITEV